MDMKVKITIQNLDRVIEVPVGQDLRSALLENDIEVYKGFIPRAINCHGKGLCGLCQIEVLDGVVTPASFYETTRIRTHPISLIETEDPAHKRLACLARCYQDATVRTAVTPSDIAD